MTRFMNLAFQHMADTADRLNDFPEQFEPLFGLREIEGREITIVEEWCFGYMRGVALSDWSALPDTLKPALDAIALHGTEENFEVVEKLTPEAFEESVEAIRGSVGSPCILDGAPAGNASAGASESGSESRPQRSMPVWKR